MCRETRSEQDQTLFCFIRSCAEAFSERTAIEYRNEAGEIEKVTYRRFFEDCCRAANYFQKKGIRGSAIALSGSKTYPYCVSLYAAMFDGNVVFPVNPELPLKIIRDAVFRRKPVLYIYDPFSLKPEEAEFDAGTELLSFEEFFENIRQESPVFDERPEISPYDTCLNLLTSGTTGIPKIVELRHYAVHHNVFDYEGTRELHVFPLHHEAGMELFGLMLQHGGVVCLSSFRDALDGIFLFKPDFLMTVPMLAKTLVKLDKAGMVDLTGFKTLGTCGAPPDLETLEFLRSRNIAAMNEYGSTEAGGNVGTSVLLPDEHKASIGTLNSFYEWKIDGKNGELLLRGKPVMNGYYGDAEATAKVLQDGWYHTGDVARVDENGYVYITGQIRNIILLSNGENVSPEAVELEFSQYEIIRTCMVRQQDDEIVIEVYYGDSKDEAAEQEITELVKKYNRTVPAIYRIRKTFFRYRPFKTTTNGKLIRDL